ncbi:MAG: TIM barrel protein [Verrucomicrobiales bacterium]|nr:TIM barrel protein [Verrucomicrobiales bacterium]
MRTWSRRSFQSGLAASIATSRLFAARPKRKQHPDLRGKMGIVSASLSPHISDKPNENQIRLLDLPAVLKDDLGLEILDFNTANFPSLEPDYIEKLRAAVEKSGCTATNLKLNQKVDMNSPDTETRAQAMAVYKKSIDAAKLLGCRWVRPLPRAETPDRVRHIDAFNDLIDYAGERGITVLIENFGWMMKDENSVVKLAGEIGADRISVGLDTGNWENNEIRYPALEKTFPLAVTCDFKARELTPNGADFDHSAYDLERCFQIGWDAGFRGPWAFEHGHKDFATAKQHLIWMREQVETWTKRAIQTAN